MYTLPGWASTMNPASEVITIQNDFVNQKIDSQAALKRYEAEKIEPLQAVLTNILPFGIGSFQQGDTIGGVLISIVDIAALVVIGMGLSTGGGFSGLASLWAIPIYAIGRVIGVVSPIMHANTNNSDLRKRLGLENTNVSYGVDTNQNNIYSVPVISFSGNF